MLVKFEQKRMVQNTQNFELLGKKCLTFFEKALIPFWKRFLYNKQLFDAKIISKRLSSFSVPFGNPTRVTRLRFALNMAIPISTNEKGLYP